MLPLLAATLLSPSREAPNVIEPGAPFYPADALAAKLRGDVAVHLLIAPDGTLRCTAHSAPSLAALRRPSCELIARRDVFAPRVGRAGRAIDTQLDLIVRWRPTDTNAQFGGAVPIGRDYWIRHADFPTHLVGRFVTGQVCVRFDITATGRIDHCAVERSSQVDAFDAAACPLLVKRATLLPALDEAGVPRATQGWFAVAWRDTPMSEDFTLEDGHASRGLAE